MRLSDTGEGRVRGYLFVLKKSLKSFLPPAMVEDALREIESHLRERIEQSEAEPDERAALEEVLAQLGEPMRVAQAYSGELVIEEAVVTGRIGSIARALWHLATSTVLGFVMGLVLLIGYSLGLSLVAVALLKPIFPDRVGVVMTHGFPTSFGMIDSVPPGTEVYGGFWVIPIAIALGWGALVATHRAAKWFLATWRRRRAPELPKG